MPRFAHIATAFAAALLLAACASRPINPPIEKYDRGYGYRFGMRTRRDDEQVDRLRRAAGEIIRAAPEYQRLLRDLGRSPTAHAAAVEN